MDSTPLTEYSNIDVADLYNDIMTGDKHKVAIIGLGYVGLPLLCQFSKKFDCLGLDIDGRRIEELSMGEDRKHCVPMDYMKSVNLSCLTTSWDYISDCEFFIVTAPTPISSDRKPEITSLKDISENLGRIIKPGAIIIFESTVSPGTTEDVCATIIERVSGLKLNHDFYVGYSPERINIGDSDHTLSNVPKIISASNSTSLDAIKTLYKEGLGCEIVKASSIRVAEAAKLYENVQRDVLIALANQYSEYCQTEGIDINEVTKCASTKWNFQEVYPGMVGGHCIGVDPYYLLERAERINVEMPIVEVARSINEGVAHKIATKILTYVQKSKNPSVLILGASYKANTGDVRNSKVFDVADELIKVFCNVRIYDPLVAHQDMPERYSDLFINRADLFCKWDVVAELVPHSAFGDIKIPDATCRISLKDLV